MTMFFLQILLWMLLAFLVGALIAWFVVRAMYDPIEDVEAELASEAAGGIQ